MNALSDYYDHPVKPLLVFTTTKYTKYLSLQGIAREAIGPPRELSIPYREIKQVVAADNIVDGDCEWPKKRVQHWMRYKTYENIPRLSILFYPITERVENVGSRGVT